MQRVIASASGLPWRSASGGLSIALIAVVALVGVSGLPFGTAEQPGPAAVPAILAALLLVLGIIIAIEGILQGTRARQGRGGQ